MPSKAIEMLTDDHHQVKAMFEEYEDLAGDDSRDDEKLTLVQQICHELTVHAQIEEEVFYPAARKALDDEDLIDEAVVEHAGIKDLIEELKAMEPSDELFDAKVTVLKEYVEHHVKEEEEELFPKAKKASDFDEDDIGAQLADRKEELMAMAGAGARKASEPQRPGANR